MKKANRMAFSYEKLRRMEALLQTQWGALERKPPRPPLNELILTLLSQNTSDRNSARAFRALRERWPDWKGLMKAPPREIEKAIQEGGLAHIKSGRVKAILEQIWQERGTLSLDFLRSWPDQEVWDYLMSFQGVGPKTAACVMLFSLNRPAFPVDTHVFRVMGRVMGMKETMSPGQMQQELQTLIPPVLMYSLHLHLVHHGRRICRPRDPLCSKCNLLILCAYGKFLTRPRSRSSDTSL